jgi:hypothetical protein
MKGLSNEPNPAVVFGITMSDAFRAKADVMRVGLRCQVSSNPKWSTRGHEQAGENARERLVRDPREVYDRSSKRPPKQLWREISDLVPDTKETGLSENDGIRALTSGGRIEKQAPRY